MRESGGQGHLGKARCKQQDRMQFEGKGETGHNKGVGWCKSALGQRKWAARLCLPVVVFGEGAGDIGLPMLLFILQ